MGDSKASEIRNYWKRRGDDRYSFHRFLNNSHFGKVALFHDVVRKKDVAGKIVNRPREGEAYHWPILRHVNLMTLIENISLSEQIRVYIMPLLKMSLFEFIYQVRFYHEPYPFPRKKAYMQDVLWALDYLHDKKLCLMNLNEKNIWISPKTDTAVIGNFSSMIPIDNVTIETLSVVDLYKPPEVLNRNSTEFFNGISAEMWACGVMIMQLFCGDSLANRLPFHFNSAEAVVTVLDFKESLSHDLLFAANPGPDLPANVAVQFREFLRGFLQLDPMLRISAKIAATDAFLRDKVRFTEHHNIGILPGVHTYQNEPTFSKVDQATQMTLNRHPRHVWYEYAVSQPKYIGHAYDVNQNCCNVNCNRNHVYFFSPHESNQVVNDSGDGVTTDKVHNYFLDRYENENKKTKTKIKENLTKLCTHAVSNGSQGEPNIQHEILNAHKINFDKYEDSKQCGEKSKMANVIINTETDKPHTNVKQIDFTLEKYTSILNDDKFNNVEDNMKYNIAYDPHSKHDLTIDNQAASRLDNDIEVNCTFSLIENKTGNRESTRNLIDYYHDVTATTTSSLHNLLDYMSYAGSGLTKDQHCEQLDDRSKAVVNGSDNELREESSAESNDFNPEITKEGKATCEGNIESPNVAWNLNYGKNNELDKVSRIKKCDYMNMRNPSDPFDLPRNCAEAEDYWNQFGLACFPIGQLKERGGTPPYTNEIKIQTKAKKRRARKWFCLKESSNESDNSQLTKKKKNANMGKRPVEQIRSQGRCKYSKRIFAKKYLVKRKPKKPKDSEDIEPFVHNIYDVETAYSSMLSVIEEKKVSVPNKTSKWHKWFCIG